jgi:hypothetical protein
MHRVGGDILSNRALNRATLSRQLLLDRSGMTPLEAVEHLVGLQAQNPLDPYLALWSRLDGFDPHVFGALLEDRSLVRIAVMRATIHLVTADDALVLRPLTQPVLAREIARHPEYAPQLVGVDIEQVLAYAHPLLTETPMSGRRLRAALAERFPDLPAAAVAYACRCYLPLVQVPPRGVWGKTLQVTSTPLDTWVGRPLRSDVTIDEATLRYLAAFGPAAIGDVAAWSRLTGFREVIDRLRPQLRTFTDEKGRELVDIPDATRPDPATPVPVRFLPEYDNVLLSHADRSRFGENAKMFTGDLGTFKGSVLVDGMVRASWYHEVDNDAGTATVAVHHLPIPAASRQAVESEGLHVARFWNPGADRHEVRMTPIA